MAEQERAGYQAFKTRITERASSLFRRDGRKSWVPLDKEECRFTVCHVCRSSNQERSRVSLDAVLNGDALPSVVTGFAFSHLGERPVGDVEIVKNLGCRPIPIVSDSHRIA